jgi:hypothetical protein
MNSAAANSAFLMGRILYSEWSDYWPQQADDVPFASFINSIPKYVVSSTLTSASCTTRPGRRAS